MNAITVKSAAPEFVLYVTLSNQPEVVTNWESLMINCEIKGWEIGDEINGAYQLTKNGKVIGSFTEEIYRS